MFFERIYEKGLAQASYFIGCQATKEEMYISKNLDTIQLNEKIVAYSTSCDRSAIVESYLIRIGYKNVFDLSGGINNWLQSGGKIEKLNKEEMVYLAN